MPNRCRSSGSLRAGAPAAHPPPGHGAFRAAPHQPAGLQGVSTGARGLWGGVFRARLRGEHRCSARSTHGLRCGTGRGGGGTALPVLPHPTPPSSPRRLPAGTYRAAAGCGCEPRSPTCGLCCCCRAGSDRGRRGPPLAHAALRGGAGRCAGRCRRARPRRAGTGSGETPPGSPKMRMGTLGWRGEGKKGGGAQQPVLMERRGPGRWEGGSAVPVPPEGRWSPGWGGGHGWAVSALLQPSGSQPGSWGLCPTRGGDSSLCGRAGSVPVIHTPCFLFLFFFLLFFPKRPADAARAAHSVAGPRTPSAALPDFPQQHPQNPLFGVFCPLPAGLLPAG